MDPTMPYARAMLEVAAPSAEPARRHDSQACHAGLDRAKRRGVTLGRSKIARKIENARLRTGEADAALLFGLHIFAGGRRVSAVARWSTPGR